MLYPAATSADSPLAHMVVHPVQLALVVLFHPPTGANTALALGQLALCGGIYIYIYICQDGGAVGFVDFTKLLFALSSLSQPFNRVRSISEYFFVIVSQRKACAGRFCEETAGKRTGAITRWPPRRLLFTRLEIAFVTISPFTKRTNVVHKVIQEG